MGDLRSGHWPMGYVVGLTNFFLLGLAVVVLVVTPSMLLFDFITVFVLNKGSFLGA